MRRRAASRAIASEQRAVHRRLAHAPADAEKHATIADLSWADGNRFRSAPYTAAAMFFSSTKKSAMPSPDEALPGRTTAIRVGDTHFVNGHRIVAAVSRGHEARDVRHGLLLGRRAQVLADPGRLLDRGRLRRRLHAEPDLRGGLLGHDRPHRGRARDLRPEAGQLREAARRCSGRATIRPRACARATTPARSTARASTRSTRRAGGRGRGSRDDVPGAPARRRPRRDHDRDPSTRRRSITPRTITSSTSARTRAATAASAAPASAARSGSRANEPAFTSSVPRAIRPRP